MKGEEFVNYIKNNFILILVCITAVVMHFIYLDKAPSGWNVDEAGSALDAWYIAHFGTDRYGFSYPILFYNYGGGGQSALFTYLVSAFIKIFGFSLYTVRSVSAIMSLIPLFGGIVWLKIIGADKKYINIYALIYTVAPYFFMVGRFGLDCNLMLSTSTVFLICLTLAIKYDKNLIYVFSGIAGGIVLYTYSLSYIVMIFFMLLFLVLLLFTRRLTIKKTLCLCIPMGIMASPLILEQLINIFGIHTIRIWKFTFVNLGKYRIGELGIPDLKSIPAILKTVLFNDSLNYNTNSQFFTLYWVSIPFFAIGVACGLVNFIKSIRERKIYAGNIVFLWLIAEIIMAMMLKCEVNANRINGVYFVVLLYVVYGIWNVAHRIKFERAVLCAVGAIYVVMAVMFFKTYFKTETRIHREYFGYTIEEVLTDLDEMENLAQCRVYIGGCFNFYNISRLELNDKPETKKEIESDRYQFGLPDNPTEYVCYILLDSDWPYCDKLYPLGLRIKEYKNGIKLFYPG